MDLAWVTVPASASMTLSAWVLPPTKGILPNSFRNSRTVHDGGTSDAPWNPKRRPLQHPCARETAIDDAGPDDSCHVSISARGVFLRHAAGAVASGVAAIGTSTRPVWAMDPQRERNTALPAPPALLLPVQRIRLAAAKIVELVKEPSGWEEATALLESPMLSEPEFTTTLNRYSDSNWEKHMLGDLYRNQGLESIKALKEVMAFSLEQQGKGVEIPQDDIDDVGEAGRTLLASLDDFVSLAPQADVRLVEKLVAESSR